MAVRRGIIAELRPFAGSRQPSFRASRQIQSASLYELFGGVDGQSISISVDAAIRVIRPFCSAFDTSIRVTRQFALSADLRQSTGRRVILQADAKALISGVSTIHTDALLRIGRRVTRLADLSQSIGVGVAVQADAAFTIYRVVLNEDHLILT